MNARQKAKYYKKKYEELANTPIIPKEYIHKYSVDTLRMKSCYPDTAAVRDHEYIQKIIRKDFALHIEKKLDKYMEYRVEYDPEINHFLVDCQMKVVRP